MILTIRDLCNVVLVQWFLSDSDIEMGNLPIVSGVAGRLSVVKKVERSERSSWLHSRGWVGIWDVPRRNIGEDW